MELVISLWALFSEELSQSQWMVTPTFQGLKLPSWSSFSLNSISDPSGYSLVLPPEHLQNLSTSPHFASQSSHSHRGLSSGWGHILLSYLPASTLGEIWEASFLVLCKITSFLCLKTSSSFPSRSESKSSSRQWSTRPPHCVPPFPLWSQPLFSLTPRASLLYLKTHQAHCT